MAEPNQNSGGQMYWASMAHFPWHHDDAYAAHNTDHEQLLAQVLDIMDDFEDSNKVNFAEFCESLNDCFSGLFKNQDARLHKMLGAQHSFKSTRYVVFLCTQRNRP